MASFRESLSTPAAQSAVPPGTPPPPRCPQPAQEHPPTAPPPSPPSSPTSVAAPSSRPNSPWPAASSCPAPALSPTSSAIRPTGTPTPFHDAEYLFALNRMFHWRTLLAAYTFTGERRFATKVTDELRNWIASCPPPPPSATPAPPSAPSWASTPGASSKSASACTGAGPGSLTTLLGTDLLPPDLLRRICHQLPRTWRGSLPGQPHHLAQRRPQPLPDGEPRPPHHRLQLPPVPPSRRSGKRKPSANSSAAPPPNSPKTAARSKDARITTTAASTGSPSPITAPPCTACISHPAISNVSDGPSPIRSTASDPVAPASPGAIPTPTALPSARPASGPISPSPTLSPSSSSPPSSAPKPSGRRSANMPGTCPISPP